MAKLRKDTFTFVHSRILYWITALLLLIVGFFLRSRMILAGDFWFTPDQARDMILARDVVDFHKFILIGARSGVEGIFHGPLWIYVMSIPFALFHGDAHLVSYFYIFVSLCVVLGAFFAIYKLYNKWAALLMLLVLSFAQELYQMINDTSNAHGLPLVLVGYLACMILFIRGKDKAIFFAVFFAGLAFEFQAAFAIFLLPYTILQALVIRRRIFTLKNIAISVGVYALSLISLILFELRHQFLETHAVMRMLFQPAGLRPIKGYEKYGDLFFRIQDRLTSLIQTPYTILAQQTVMLQILTVAIILFAGYELMRIKKHPLKKEFIFLLAFPIFVYVLYIFYPLPIWTHYTFAIPIIMAFIFIVSCCVIWKRLLGKILIACFILITIFVSLQNVTNMYRTPFVPTTDGSYINQLAVVDGIFKTAKKQPFSYFVYSPPVVTYGMDYLLWWRGVNVYGYVPTMIKAPGLMFLIMYPNGTDPSAHGYWIQHVIRTSAPIISQHVYSGNIDVQERLLAKPEAPVDPNYYLNIR